MKDKVLDEGVPIGDDEAGGTTADDQVSSLLPSPFGIQLEQHAATTELTYLNSETLDSGDDTGECPYCTQIHTPLRSRTQ